MDNQCQGSAWVQNETDYSFMQWLDTDSSTVISTGQGTLDLACVGVYYFICTDTTGTYSYAVDVMHWCDAMNMYYGLVILNETYMGECNGNVTPGSLYHHPDLYPLNPITHDWRDEFGNVISTNNALDSACAGTYIVRIEEGNGCVTLDTFTVGVQYPEPSFHLHLDIDDATPGNCDGRVRTNPIGGTPPYTYLYSDTTSNQINDGLCPGFYFVEVWDANNDYGFKQFLIVDQDYTITNSTFPDSLVTDTLNGTPIQDCSIDYANIFSSSISSTNQIGDTIYVDWIITYYNSTSTTITVPYYANSTFTGIYAFTLSVFCTQKAITGSVKVFDQSDELYLDMEEVSKENNLIIYPNPVQDILTINSEEKGELQIFDMRGSLVKEVQLELENQIVLDHLESGMYILSFKIDRHKFQKKLIKQ